MRADSKIRWRRILTGALVWATISLVVAAIDYGTNPQDYTWSFQPIWWLIVPVALVITPIQTSCEELFFRGYLMQGMALLTHNKLVLILINGILFMIPHLGNPEMQRGPLLGLDYLIAGAMLAAIAIRDNGLELALGIHAANNLQVILFNTKDSALPFPSLWYVKVTNEPIIDIIITTLEYSLFYYIFFGRKSDPSLKNQ